MDGWKTGLVVAASAAALGAIWWRMRSDSGPGESGLFGTGAGTTPPLGTSIGYSAPTLPLAAGEQRYVDDLVAVGHALYSAIDPRLRVSSTTYLGQIAQRDPFWTPANVAKRDAALDFSTWLAGLDHHAYVWAHGGDARSVGRPVHLATLPDGSVDDVPDPWFHGESSALHQDYKDWAEQLVALGVIAGSDVPAAKVQPPTLVV